MTALDPIPFDEAPRGTGTPHGVKGIASVLDSHGVDASSDLYDEAVVLARQGHLGRARDRLRMLLCLDPHDAAAHLLLAKVFGSQQRWSDSIKELDAAQSCGMRVDPTLRGRFEAARDASRDDAARSERITARTAGEVKALREEARRLRAENTRLERIAKEETDKARLWMSATTVAAIIGLFGLGMTLAFGGDDAPVPAELGPEIAAPVNAAPVGVASGADVPSAGNSPGADPVVTPPAPAAPPAGARTYTVRSGDSLAGISGKVYGTEARWKELQDANPSLNGGIALQPGMELVVP
jgi:LysM repeat protein